MPFCDIIGHSNEIRILRSLLRSDHVPHAYVFAGIAGVGKRQVALGFAQALNCGGQADDFCGLCPSCSKTARMVHPDVFVVEPETAVIKIEQIRSLQDELAYAAIEGPYRTVIIDQCEKMNVQAANCLLKTLEEPPDNTVIILLARAFSALLPTIRSRCQLFRFAPLRPGELAAVLQRCGSGEQHIEEAAPYAGGSVERALYLCESGFLTRRRDIAGMLAGTGEADFSVLVDFSEKYSKNKEELPLVLEFLQSWYRDLLFVKQRVSPGLLMNADMQDLLRQAADRETAGSLMKKLSRIGFLQNSEALNLDMRMGLESVLLG